MKLVFGYEAAQALGVSPWFVSSLKRAGAPFWGYKTNVDALEKWLRANPDFVARHQWDRPSVKPAGRRSPGRRRLAEAAGKSGE